MIQAIRCLFGYHGKAVMKEYLGFMDLYDMEVCEFCEKPVTGERDYYRLDKKYGYKWGGNDMKNKGFTLIELLVVIAIIGILAAVAIPQFMSYSRRGFDADVRSNVKNMILAQEAYFIDLDTYATGTGTSLVFLDRGFRLSPNVNVVSTNFSTFFTVTANAIKGCSAGTGVWTYNSATGSHSGTRCN